MAVVPPDCATSELLHRWETDGWFVIREFFDQETVAAAVAEFKEQYFPDMRSVWREPDPRLKSEQFAGIIEFPFKQSPLLNQAAFDERIYELATELLQDPNIVMYQVQAWAKYTEAANYDQLLHRDFRNHTLVVPDQDRPEYRQMEAMLLLTDVSEDLGPTHLVSRKHTRQVPVQPEFLEREGNEWLYELEESAAAPAGSLLVYAPDVIHRGTDLTKPGGSRFVVSIGYQRRGVNWMGYHCWPKSGSWPSFMSFVRAASPTQLKALGFPMPSDPYWTVDTRAAVAERYLGLDLDRYLAEG
jgi:hypothetical protein